ncbi:hypothetical protein [Endozoicomonas atrinae]|uniref:hypothetical protein n=1 Tax=Endozoicomonas atrinae TaxID=1333660 RepID=UPI003AFFC408
MINDNVGAQPAGIVQNTEYERQGARTIRQDGVDRAGRSVFCQSCLGLVFDEQQEKEGVFVNLSIYGRTVSFLRGILPIPLSLGWPLLKFAGECWFVAKQTLPDGVAVLSLVSADSAGKGREGYVNIRSISCSHPNIDVGNEIRLLIDNKKSFLINDNEANSGLGDALQKAGIVHLIGKPIDSLASERLCIVSLVEAVRIPLVEEVLDPFVAREVE